MTEKKSKSQSSNKASKDWYERAMDAVRRGDIPYVGWPGLPIYKHPEQVRPIMAPWGTELPASMTMGPPLPPPQVSAPLAPPPQKHPPEKRRSTTLSSRLKWFWPEVYQFIFDLLDKNGGPPKRGSNFQQQSIEYKVDTLIKNRGWSASERSIRTHVQLVIKKYKENSPGSRP